MTFLRILFVAASAAAFWSTAAQPTDAATTTTIVLTPCRLPKWTEDVRCGTYDVFEDRASKTGRRITLRIVVIPASVKSAEATPVFFFSGGPGQSSVDVANIVGPNYLAGLGREHDIVYIDRRGTGAPNGLNCHLYGATPTMSAYLSGYFSLDAVTSCRADLARRANLDLYGTAIASADVDEIRQALGYDRIDLYGGSYGTASALDYIRRFGKHVRSAILVGVAPPENLFPLPFSRGTQAAADTMFADCAADSVCARAYPHFRADFDSVLARLHRAPFIAHVKDLTTGQPTEVTVTYDGFVEHLRVMLYAEDYVRVLPLVVRDAAAGHFERFIALGYAIYKGTDDQIARGLQFSVVCSEAMPALNYDAARREAANSFYGIFRTDLYIETCKRWAVRPAPAAIRAPVVSSVPVLMLSGAADPVAPPWLGAEAVKHLANGRQLVIPHAGHNVTGPCVDSLVTQFARAGTANGLDTSCVARHVRPAFIAPP